MKSITTRTGVLLATFFAGLLLTSSEPSSSIPPISSHSNHISEITLSHRGCYGPCPIYDVTLRSNGTATLMGHRYVERLGSYHAKPYQFDFDRLAYLIQAQGFFEFEDKYAQGWVDAEVVTTIAVRDGKRKTVTTYNSGEPPEALWAIDAVIRDVVSKIEWEVDCPSCSESNETSGTTNVP